MLLVNTRKFVVPVCSEMAMPIGVYFRAGWEVGNSRLNEAPYRLPSPVCLGFLNFMVRPMIQLVTTQRVIQGGTV